MLAASSTTLQTLDYRVLDYRVKPPSFDAVDSIDLALPVALRQTARKWIEGNPVAYGRIGAKRRGVGQLQR
jgi:hypothetical protein